jgi:hypothetical protein
VSSNGNKEWILTSRKDNVREILVFPRKHKTNKELISSEPFWKWVFNDVVDTFFKGKFQLDKYPVECFAMNFGEWESEEAVDKYAKNCHGHLHIHLEIGLAREMEKNFTSMQGKVNDPIIYTLKDCKMLETSRLMSLEVSSMRQEISSIKQELSDVKKKLSNVENSLNLIMKHLGIDSE